MKERERKRQTESALRKGRERRGEERRIDSPVSQCRLSLEDMSSLPQLSFE